MGKGTCSKLQSLSQGRDAFQSIPLEWNLDGAVRTKRPNLPGNPSARPLIDFPGITVGCWQQPDATSEAIFDSWLDTGDVMFADPDGYLCFHGQKTERPACPAGNRKPGFTIEICNRVSLGPRMAIAEPPFLFAWRNSRFQGRAGKRQPAQDILPFLQQADPVPWSPENRSDFLKQNPATPVSLLFV